ncbi:phage minor head protein [Ruminococcus sp.]|uniref:phage minor head protein n=1 Tax=Ruminococcus sp. TaxID=41978 RepID=UPI00300F5E50
MATLWDYQRQLRRVAASRNRSAVQELRQVYADVLQQLQGILGKYYTAYGSGTESTLSQADLRLAGQYQSFLYDVQKQLDGLSAPVQSRIRQTITDTYTLCYDGMAAAVRQAAQGNRTLQEALRGLSDTTPETVRHLVEHPMQELTLSDVFQRQRSRVIREIKKTLTTGLAVGDSYTRMSQAIADVLGGDLAKAQRIVRTEAHRAISRGFQDVSDQTAYLLRESPYMEVKEWCSAEDGDVRSAHRKLDGVVLPVGEEFEVDGKRAACPCGFGVAELDINCRCFLKYSLVLRSEFEDRRHKAKQEQPAAQNTPQVQAGQMTLSTASGQQTPAHAVAVQPTAPPEDGETGTVYLPEKISGKPLTSEDSGGIMKRGMNRRSKNIGKFSELKIPMQKKAVLNICKKYNVETSGLRFKIQRDEKLITLPFYGSTDYNDIGRIDLFPNAFSDEEQLIRTVIHEKCHVKQLKKYGKEYAQKHLQEMEKQAYRLESIYYHILKKRV